MLAQQSAALSAGGERLARRAPALNRQAARDLAAVEARVRALDPGPDAGPGLEHHAHAPTGDRCAAPPSWRPGDAVVTTLVDGEVRSRVEEVQGP